MLVAVWLFSGVNRYFFLFLLFFSFNCSIGYAVLNEMPGLFTCNALSENTWRFE